MPESDPAKPARQPQPAGSAGKAPLQRRASAPRRTGKAVSPEESQLQNWQLAKHESRRKKRKGQEGFGQLNLTSMIDVIFLLLIYFVITASFVENEGVLVAKLPAGSGIEAPPEELPPQNIDIFLNSYDATGARISVGGAAEFTSFSELRAHLISIQNNPAKGRSGWAALDNPIIIRPSGDVRWNHVVDAFNASFGAGYANISFAQTGGEQG